MRGPRQPLPGVPANAVLPLIHGRAHVTLDATLIFDPADAFAWGLDVTFAVDARHVSPHAPLPALPATQHRATCS